MIQRKMTRVIESKQFDINDVSSSEPSFMNDVAEIVSENPSSATRVQEGEQPASINKELDSLIQENFEQIDDSIKVDASSN